MSSIAVWARRAAAADQTRRGVRSNLIDGKKSRLRADRKEYEKKRAMVAGRREEAYQRALEKASNNKDVLRRVREGRRGGGRGGRGGRGGGGGAASQKRTLGASAPPGVVGNAGASAAEPQTETTTTTQQQRGQSSLRGGGRDVWADVYEYQRHILEQEQAATRRENARRREDLTRTLDVQKREKVAGLEAERRDLHDFAKAQSDDVEEWKKSELRKRKEQIMKNHRNKEARNLQMADLRARRAAEERRKLDEEQATVKLHQLELKEEEDRQRQLKQKRQQALEQFKIANARGLELKAQKLQEEKNYEKRLAREYMELMDKQERDRNGRLAEMEERQRKLGRIGMMAADDVEARHNADEERAAMWRQRYEEEADRKLAAKRARQEKDKQDMLSALARQVAAKEAAARKEAEDTRRFAQEQDRKAEMLASKDDVDVSRRRRANKEYEAAVLQQAREKRAASKKVPMDLTEEKFNADLLRKVAEFKASKRRDQQEKRGRRIRISQVPL
eukprot:g1325.t1